MNALSSDGRFMRSVITRKEIVIACRALMVSGHLRPTVIEIADVADTSVRTVHVHFSHLEKLHAEALDEGTVQQIVRNLLWGDDGVADWRRIVRSLVLGRPE